jgi:hypothetical protein
VLTPPELRRPSSVFQEAWLYIVGKAVGSNCGREASFRQRLAIWAIFELAVDSGHSYREVYRLGAKLSFPKAQRGLRVVY